MDRQTVDVHVISYNMGMGASREKGNPIASCSEAFDMFKEKFVDMWKEGRAGVWFLCVQEIDLDLDGQNQLEELQDYLNANTDAEWHKHSKTRPGSGDEEAAAVYSTCVLTKYKKMDIGDDRTAIAVKAKLPDQSYLWVTTTHLIAGKEDPDGTKRRDELEQVLKELVTCDGTVPMVFTGDFNVTDYVADEGRDPAELAFDNAVYDQTVGKLQRFGYSRGFTPTIDDFTFPAWASDSDSRKIIDYIFCLDGGGLNPQRIVASKPRFPNPNFYRTDKNGNKIFASDHRGVYMRFTVS